MSPLPSLRPDLKIRDLSIRPSLPYPPVPPLPGILLLSFTVVNIGRTPSHPISSKIGVYVNAISWYPPPGQNQIQIQKGFPLPALPPGVGKHFDVPFSVRELRAKRIRRFEVIADPKNLIPEGNEYNNFASISI
jgi:hypothetical protein